MAIDLNAGAQQLLILRRESHVELRAVSVGDYVLLDAFSRDEDLESALLQAIDADASFDVPSALPRLAQLGVFDACKEGLQNWAT